MKTFYIIFSSLFVPFLVFLSLAQRLRSIFNNNCLNSVNSRKVVFGSTPLLNNKYWSKALCDAGHYSKTFVSHYFDSISKESDWDYLLTSKFKYVPSRIKPFFAFALSLFKYDIFVLSYRGFFLQNTALRYLQAQLLKLANKKIIILPYGSDAYVYKNIRSSSMAHALMISYPLASRNQNRILKDIDYWNQYADAVIPSVMGFDGLGRWDTIVPNSLALDLEKWNSSKRVNLSNGVNGCVNICHSPNHRGSKGSEFIINSINQLKKEGLDIELLLLEGVQNDEVQSTLNSKVDILIDQLVLTGHGLHALEGMASGLPTIVNLEDETYTLPMRRWSFLNECPLVSATPEDITDVLRELITNPSLRIDLGRAGREYVEKYHGLDSAQYLFENVFDYIYGKKDSIINLYHPILGEYPNRSPKVKHPLVNNRIVDYQS